MFIGIDPSLTETGIVVLDSTSKIVLMEVLKTKPSKEKKYDLEMRLLEISSRIISILKKYSKKDKPSINIEGISFGSTGQGKAQLAALNFLIRIQLLQNRYDFVVTPPQALKKFLTGKGNSKKSLVIKEVYKKYGEEIDNDNLADAYVLARMSYERR